METSIFNPSYPEDHHLETLFIPETTILRPFYPGDHQHKPAGADLSAWLKGAHAYSITSVCLSATPTHTQPRAELAVSHQPCHEKVHCAEFPPVGQLYVCKHLGRL